MRRSPTGHWPHRVLSVLVAGLALGLPLGAEARGGGGWGGGGPAGFHGGGVAFHGGGFARGGGLARGGQVFAPRGAAVSLSGTSLRDGHGGFRAGRSPRAVVVLRGPRGRPAPRFATIGIPPLNGVAVPPLFGASVPPFGGLAALPVPAIASGPGPAEIWRWDGEAWRRDQADPVTTWRLNRRERWSAEGPD